MDGFFRERSREVYKRCLFLKDTFIFSSLIRVCSCIFLWKVCSLLTVGGVHHLMKCLFIVGNEGLERDCWFFRFDLSTNYFFRLHNDDSGIWLSDSLKSSLKRNRSIFLNII